MLGHDGMGVGLVSSAVLIVAFGRLWVLVCLKVVLKQSRTGSGCRSISMFVMSMTFVLLGGLIAVLAMGCVTWVAF